MTTITILPESVGKDEIIYRAIAGTRQSKGRTAGEALDALTKQLSEDEVNTLVIVQNLRPDLFFTAKQQRRLHKLMARWRLARDTGIALPPKEQAELEMLIEAELEAATKRAETLSSQLNQ